VGDANWVHVGVNMRTVDRLWAVIKTEDHG
jgi:hypothetical protein